MSTVDKRRVWRVAIIAVGSLGAITCLFLFLIYFGSDPTGFKAILTLLGVLVTAGVSLLATNQSNKRLAQEAAVNSERLAQEAIENAERLRLDAAMRAGSLVGPSKDSLPLSSASAASGLLALTRLHHSELAVALLVDLWSGKSDDDASGKVSNETAVLVIDAALRDGPSCPNAALIAAELLCRNAKMLDACQSLHWPSAIDGRWVPEVGPKTKLLLFDALVIMTINSEANENALRSLAVRLYGIWEGDPDGHVKGCAGVLIKAILPFLEDLKYTNFMHGPMDVTTRELKTAAGSATRNPDDYLARMTECRGQELAAWARRCIGKVSDRAGALADGSCDISAKSGFRVAV